MFAQAQTQTTVTNPRVVSFTPSPDQDKVDSSGQPLVTQYNLQFVPVGGSQPVQVLNLGKPTPGADGLVTVDFSAMLTSPPAPGQQLDAMVAAVGPTGSGVSAPSNSFMFDCTATVSPASVSGPAQGGTASIGVTVYNGCAWQATSAASWISIASGSSGSGNGAVMLSVAANTTTAPRTGTATVAGQVVTVTQTAATSSNIPPSVTLASPANGATFTAPASITLAASARDTDGTVSRVDYYASGAFLGSAASPYTFAWTNVAAGNYTITAVATDNLSAQGTSAPVAITVTAPAPSSSSGNVLPTVQITSPTNGTTLTTQSAIGIRAAASDSDGTVSRVDFYASGALVGSATASPYTVKWNPSRSGTYTLTAVATDNAGKQGMSSAVSLTVNKRNGKR